MFRCLTSFQIGGNSKSGSGQCDGRDKRVRRFQLEMNNGQCPLACPFQDGLFYDPKDRLYKMWYHAGWFDGTAYAYSEDGIKWVRPNLDIEPGTNRVLPLRAAFERDGAGMWLDQETSNPAERFKMFLYERQYDRREPAEARLMPGKSAAAGGTVYTLPDGNPLDRSRTYGPVRRQHEFLLQPVP